MNKGEILDKIFKRMDELNLHSKMNQLFIDNGMNICDLNELRERNPNALKQWYKYYHRSRKLMAMATFTVLNK